MIKKEENKGYDKINNKYEWERVWEYHKEADNLFHRRFNFFLVAESMLIVSFVTLLNSSYTLVMIAIILLGLVYTFGWFYVNARINFRIEFLKEKYLKNDPIYEKYMHSVDDIFENREKPQKTIHFQVYVLPKMTFLFWLFLLFHTIMNLHIVLIVFLLLMIYLLLRYFLINALIPRYNSNF